MTTITLFAEFWGCRYNLEDKYIRFPDAESAGKLMAERFPKAAFYVADITGRSYSFHGDAFDFARAYNEKYPL